LMERPRKARSNQYKLCRKPDYESSQFNFAHHALSIVKRIAAQGKWKYHVRNTRDQATFNGKLPLQRQQLFS
jgi:hypothetical protein